MIKLSEIKLVKTCSACPEQYDAFYEDHQVGYLRVRHGCDLFYNVVDKIYPPEQEYWYWEQGFVTNKYRFVSREGAWIIAEKQGQIIRDHNVCVGTLYSEHLY